MKFNLVGAFIRNAPFGTEIAFKKGLEKLGHSVNSVDTSYPGQEWDRDADATVVFKWMEGYWDELDGCGGKKIVYQPDDLRFPQIEEMMRDMRRHCPYALTFDAGAAKTAESRLGYARASRLLLTADPDLYRFSPDVEKDVDLCFVGSMTGGECHKSRRRMVDVLRAAGFRVLVVSDFFDAKTISQIYNASRVVLNHATDVGQSFGFGHGLQCRHFEVGMSGACLLTNSVIDDDGSLVGFVTFDGEGDLVEKARWLLDERQSAASAARILREDVATRHMPWHRASELVEFVESLR